MSEKGFCSSFQIVSQGPVDGNYYMFKAFCTSKEHFIFYNTLLGGNANDSIESRNFRFHFTKQK